MSTLVVIAFSKISLTMLLDLKSSILYVFYHGRKTIIMSKYIEYQDKVAFHPGYYVKEIIEETGVIQEDFARCLGTTPENLSILINGEQSLSIDLAASLSRMLGTSITYWLNLQQKYNEIQTKFYSA